MFANFWMAVNVALVSLGGLAGSCLDHGRSVVPYVDNPNYAINDDGNLFVYAPFDYEEVSGDYIGNDYTFSIVNNPLDIYGLNYTDWQFTTDVFDYNRLSHIEFEAGFYYVPTSFTMRFEARGVRLTSITWYASTESSFHREDSAWIPFYLGVLKDNETYSFSLECPFSIYQYWNDNYSSHNINLFNEWSWAWDSTTVRLEQLYPRYLAIDTFTWEVHDWDNSWHKLSFHANTLFSILCERFYMYTLAGNSYSVGYKTGYEEGFDDGDWAGYARGYEEGASEAQSGTLITNLFGAVVSIPMKILSGLSVFSIFNVPIVSILATLLFIGLILWIIKRFI